MKRIAVFVDGANVFYAQKSMGWQIDAKKLLDYCKEFGEVVEAIYYTGFSGETRQRKFLNWLSHNGYSLVTKPLKTITDLVSGRTTQKASLDIEIVLDMFNLIDRYDTAILISGDGDFERALQQVKSRGKEVKILSTHGKIASELVYAAGINYIDFLSIRDSIERSPVEENRIA